MIYKTITTFNDVEIKLNTLIICDIDNTILKYKKDYNYFVELNNQHINNIYLSHVQAYTDYELYKANNCYKEIMHTDFDGFNNMINKNNGNIIFLTARHRMHDQFTRDQLNIIKINDCQIYYTNDDISKGVYIKYNLDLKHYDEIIFIDDQDENLQSVNELNPNIICYKFIINNI